MDRLLTEWPSLGLHLQPHQIIGLACLIRATVVARALGLLLMPRPQHRSSSPAAYWAAFTGRGFILAHSMGLGKTVTSIAFLCVAHAVTRATLAQALHRQGVGGLPRPFVALIVVPKSAVDPWCEEVETWWLRFNTADAPLRRLPGANAQWQHLSLLNLVDIRDSGANLTGVHNAVVRAVDEERRVGGAVAFVLSYELLTSLNKELMTFAGDVIVVDVTVVDEAHRIQRHGTLLHTAVVTTVSSCRVFLTGYPMQNNAREFDLLMRMVDATNVASSSSSSRVAPLPTADDFEERIGNVLEGAAALQRALRDVTRRAAVLRSPQFAAVMAAVSELRLLAKGRCHRATVASVAAHGLGLPDVEHLVVYCAMTPLQRVLYDTVLQSSSAAGAGFFARAAWLSMICVHPTVFDARKIAQAASQRAGVADAIEELSDPHPGEDGSSLSPRIAEALLRAVSAFGSVEFAELHHGAKMSVLIDLVQEAGKRGEKTVVFSHFSTVVHVVERFFNATNVKTSVNGGAAAGRPTCLVTLTGDDSAAQRRAAIRAFQHDPTVMVLAATTRAAGVALNLTSATRVVMLDCHWNPCHEAQAFHRCIRLGMKGRRVTLVRLLCPGTLEVVVREMQRAKEGVFHHVFDEMVAAELPDADADPLASVATTQEDVHCQDSLVKARFATCWHRQGSALAVCREEGGQGLDKANDLDKAQDDEDEGVVFAIESDRADDEDDDPAVQLATSSSVGAKHGRKRRGRTQDQELLAELRRSSAHSSRVAPSHSDLAVFVDVTNRLKSTPPIVNQLDDELAALLDAAAAAGA